MLIKRGTATGFEVVSTTDAPNWVKNKKKAEQSKEDVDAEKEKDASDKAGEK